MTQTPLGPWNMFEKGVGLLMSANHSAGPGGIIGISLLGASNEYT